MSGAPRLELRQGQSLVMTPQLQQAIKLLQLSNLELAEFIDREVEQNPLLERADTPRDDVDVPTAGEPEGSGANPAADSRTSTREEGWGQGSEQFAEWGRTGGSFNGTDAYSLENVLTRDITLREHLIEQLNIELDETEDRLLGLFLIDQLDESGYCKEDTAAMADLLSCDPARLEAVRQKLMRLDPLGIGARHLGECLALQLAERDRLDPAMQTLLDHLDLLAARDYKPLIKLCGVDAEDLKDMVAEIQSLNPRPATGFATGPALAIQPDVLMRATPAGGWVVELNPATLPRVLVNEPYFARITQGTRSKEERDYLSERFASANWLVKSLHQRAQTILKVSSEIVRRQQDFFTHGIMHLKPLILKDIAEIIEMHESTVSRVTANKFIATPRGVFELKYFFTTAISGADGESHSAEAVRHRVRELIAAEDPKAILSDDTLVEKLKAEGIDIARRTVAKYREALGIPSSVQRRREKAGIGFSLIETAIILGILGFLVGGVWIAASQITETVRLNRMTAGTFQMIEGARKLYYKTPWANESISQVLRDKGFVPPDLVANPWPYIRSPWGTRVNITRRIDTTYNVNGFEVWIWLKDHRTANALLTRLSRAFGNSVFGTTCMRDDGASWTSWRAVQGLPNCPSGFGNNSYIMIFLYPW